MTPIGNPQNLLIALQSGIPLPFITFLRYLGIPTIVNLFLTYLILKVYYRNDLLFLESHTTNAVNTNSSVQSYHDVKTQHTKKENLIGDDYYGKNIANNYWPKENVFVPDLAAAEGRRVTNPRLAKISIGILLATIAGFIISDTLQFVYPHNTANLSLSIIAMLGATVLYALSKERREILVSVDYSVLVFFAAMFVFTYGLWSSGLISLVLSHFPTPNRHDIIQSTAAISAISITLSQILSNVPFVAIYNTVMINNGFTNGTNAGSAAIANNTTSQWMMLAAASTIAGNLTILAAASNIIIIEAAESRGIKAFTFFEYLKIGAVVTLANIVVYYLFMKLL
jgi:Na+/H+ antiporter NhaD/arsenite permease-like protein